MSRDLVVGITVREALTLGCLSEAKLAAGHTSIDNVITGVNVMEVPDVWRLIGNACILDKAFSTRTDESYPNSLIPKLIPNRLLGLFGERTP